MSMGGANDHQPEWVDQLRAWHPKVENPVIGPDHLSTAIDLVLTEMQTFGPVSEAEVGAANPVDKQLCIAVAADALRAVVATLKREERADAGDPS